MFLDLVKACVTISGNNLYGMEAKQKLISMGRSKEREGYILMELIRPPVTTNYIIRAGAAADPVSIINELGIFGVILG